NIREEVNKALEEKRQEKFIGNSLEAKVELFVNEKNFKALENYRDFLPTLFIVSSVEITQVKELPDTGYRSNAVDGLVIVTEKADGEKCSRCWNYSLTTGKYEQFSDLCERCYKVLKR
ncbi:MAG: hypothetical protein JSV71_05105, partial [Nitrospiraceae bacterium]